MGGEVGDLGDSSPPSKSVLRLDPENNKFVALPDMEVARKDHACMAIEMGYTQGILVSIQQQAQEAC